MKSVGGNSNRGKTLVALAISGNKCRSQSTLYQLSILSNKIRVSKCGACPKSKYFCLLPINVVTLKGTLSRFCACAKV